MANEKIFECTRICDQYVQNAGEYYQVIADNCVNLCIKGFGQATTSALQKGLEVSLVVLIVLLVILGLIIGFNKLKGEEGEGDKEGDTYY